MGRESRKSAPAAARNREPLAQVLSHELPEAGTVLEVASGTGEHAVHFAARFPHLIWQPSDRLQSALSSIAAWRCDYPGANLCEPMLIDASLTEWPVNSAAAILCINMVHISPWEATEGLFRGGSRLLAAGAPLILYGPYFEADVETAPSNLAFDESLKSRDPRWGLREVGKLDALAEGTGFARSARYEMPANNLTLVYRQS